MGENKVYNTNGPRLPAEAQAPASASRHSSPATPAARPGSAARGAFAPASIDPVHERGRAGMACRCVSRPVPAGPPWLPRVRRAIGCVRSARVEPKVGSIAYAGGRVFPWGLGETTRQFRASGPAPSPRRPAEHESIPPESSHICGTQASPAQLPGISLLPIDIHAPSLPP